jgi:hypothetical protein
MGDFATEMNGSVVAGSDGELEMEETAGSGFGSERPEDTQDSYG